MTEKRVALAAVAGAHGVKGEVRLKLFTDSAASLARHAKVYINGIEVPAKSVSLRYGVWQIPEMQIDMVADPVITRLGAEDRVQVAVFYLDDTDVVPEVGPERGARRERHRRRPQRGQHGRAGDVTELRRATRHLHLDRGVARSSEDLDRAERAAKEAAHA